MSERISKESTLVSAIVVTWNSERDVARCIQSLLAQSHSPLEVIVVDNGSADGTVQTVKENFRDVRLIRLKGNTGFAHANNVGVLNSSGEYVLTVNPDVVLEPEYVERLLVAVHASGPVCGSATGKLIREDGVTLDSTGITTGLAIRFFDRGQGEADRGQYDASLSILGPCAAAALYRRRMLDQTRQAGEFFDSSFFAFLEDVDLALRARLAGWESVYVPGAKAAHRRGGSRTRRNLIQFYAFRNRLMLMIKDVPASVLFAQAPVLILYDISRFFWVSLGNPLALSAYYQVLSRMSTLLKQRKAILRR